MKSKFKSIIAFVICFTIVFTTLVQTVSAANEQSIKEEQAIKVAQEVFNSLSPEAKERFVTFIENEDSELLAIHKKHIDKTYDIKKAKENEKKKDTKNKKYSTQQSSTERSNINLSEGVKVTTYKPVMTNTYQIAASPTDALSLLNTRLIALDLPLLVRYTFMAMGGGLAAGLDGPLPVGDIIAVIVSIGGIAIIAYYWDDIAPKWDGIVSAFKEAFSNMASSIVSAFNNIKMMAQGLPTEDEFADFEGHYAKHSKEFADMPGGNGKKPDKKEWWKMAKKFLKKTGSDIVEGVSKKSSDLKIKFNKKTLEYIIYNPTTGQIVTCFLPKWSSYNNGTYDKWQWMIKAFEYYKDQVR